jgi:23S rRNA (adenine2503-C2)-methyltransferase
MTNSTNDQAQPADNSALNANTSTKLNFYGITQTELQKYFTKEGKEKYRSQQVYKWVYERQITDFDQMSNLSKNFRDEFKSKIEFHLPQVVSHLISIDGTQKFLFKLLSDGAFASETVEAVIIPSGDRLTLCISSEVGCNMACKFCFTGKQKLKRRLKAHEIVGQFIQVKNALQKQGPDKRISNIVYMGMGEPLDNSDEVFKSVEILHDPWGINLSRKKITISTSGIVPEMWKVADHGVRLAVSLNGSNDEVRSQVMPINKKYPLKDLLAACQEYAAETGEKVTFEYVLLKGVTDSEAQAKELFKLTRKIPCKINLIPFNEHPGADFHRPEDSVIEKFQKILFDLGAHVLIRRTMGRDIYAACGQLTSEFENKPQKMDISNSKIGSIHKKPGREIHV